MQPALDSLLVTLFLCLSFTMGLLSFLSKPASAMIAKDFSGKELATFAQGCFWGVEKSFKHKFPGAVMKVGYCGGTVESPSYPQVCTGRTGHAEALQIGYDPSTTSYASLVDFLYIHTLSRLIVSYRSHDPTTMDRQGNDRGSQYRSTIFYHTKEQKDIAEKMTAELKPMFGSAGIATTIEQAGAFYDAEAMHQDYLTVNPHGYECATHFERSWDQIKKQFAK